jgi:SAM-dependent methyltransferase
LELNLAARGDLYQVLLARLKAGGRFLDVGCCLGQDIRKLAFDGAPGEHLVGAELSEGFIELGYELFRDREKLGATLLAANILDEEGPLQELKHTFDVVQLGMILHLFSWDEQVVVFKHAIGLLKDAKGSLIIGQATGHLDGALTPGWRGNTFKHNVETFKKLIDQISLETGTRWEAQAELDTGLSIFDGKRTWDSPQTRRLVFKVEKLDS